MRIIKRLHYFVLKSFLPLFAMTFFIVLFIVLMQFLWVHLNDLVGKGLGLGVIAELFFYAAVTFVPMVLPLAILLASIMTFGNMGEKFELTAMKAAGISLLQVMAPLIILVSGIAVGAFFFQNDVLPKANVKMWTLLFSMRQKSPELEIPEGVFYTQIPGYNLFVTHKDQETGMMYDMMIYDVSRGGDNSTIILADSARLAFTKDMRFLYLHLFSGEQFENLRDQSGADRNVPFRRESFLDKEAFIPFDANFNRMDEEGMRNQYVGKNIAQLNHSIDSVNHRLDSVGEIYAKSLKREEIPLIRIDSKQEKKIAKAVAKASPVNLDSLMEALPAGKRMDILSRARSTVENKKMSYEYPSISTHDEKRVVRRHEIELLKKFTLSVACIIFFFIGAPLGAIIRKGGLGTPLVISVLFFLMYYLIDNTGYKLARDGKIAVWLGIWISTFILAPISVYITYKAIHDSAVFDKDVYVNKLRHLLGLKETRSVASKEVIMEDISRPEAIAMLVTLAADSREFASQCCHKPGYRDYFLRGVDMTWLRGLDSRLEDTVNYLLDCRDPLVVNKLSQFPLIRTLRIYHPGNGDLLSKILMWVVPIGLPLWLIARRYIKALDSETRRIATVADEIREMI